MYTKRTNHRLCWFYLAVFSLISPRVLAHASLLGSVPADNSILSVQPEQLELTFSKPVRLTRVDLEHRESGTIEFGFDRISEARDSYRWRLPGELSNGAYQVQWIALGQDGHKMKGTFTFSLVLDKQL